MILISKAKNLINILIIIFTKKSYNIIIKLKKIKY